MKCVNPLTLLLPVIVCIVQGCGNLTSATSSLPLHLPEQFEIATNQSANAVISILAPCTKGVARKIANQNTGVKYEIWKRPNSWILFFSGPSQYLSQKEIGKFEKIAFDVSVLRSIDGRRLIFTTTLVRGQISIGASSDVEGRYSAFGRKNVSGIQNLLRAISSAVVACYIQRAKNKVA